MATHKVPQDVEAEDKLLGPLSLKQLIFTIIGLAFGYLTFFFATKINIFAAFIWVPFTLSCLILGLYQRKDQPVEVYLASAIRFYLKVRRRKWDQEGYQEHVIITAPPEIIHNYTKNFTGEEATSRLSNLSLLMDSRGWASKMANDWQNPQLATAAASDRLLQPNDIPNSDPVGYSYMQPVDVMDEQSSMVAQDFQTKISQTDTSAKQHAIQVLQQARQDNSAAGTPVPVVATEADDIAAVPEFTKYPQMHQKVVAPEPIEPVLEEEKQSTPQSTVPAISKPEPQPYDMDDGSVEIKLH